MELKSWLEARTDQIVQRWRAGIRLREGRRGESGDGFLDLFLADLVAILPFCLQGSGEVGEEIWYQATHLYGSLALRRGLAAGEVVEELELLREVVLRLFLESQGENRGGRSLHKEFLVLNRLLAQGVVRASVTYVDDLFFAHLQGSGVPEGVTPDLEEETRRQLEAFRRELEDSAEENQHNRS